MISNESHGNTRTASRKRLDRLIPRYRLISVAAFIAAVAASVGSPSAASLQEAAQRRQVATKQVLATSMPMKTSEAANRTDSTRRLAFAAAICPLGQYAVEYFANRTLSGTAATTRCESPPIANDWGSGSPTGVPADHFSVRWFGAFDLAAGNYTFTAVTDDGMRVWVDDELVLDEWAVQAATTYTVSLPLAAGIHQVKVEYYENEGLAVAKLTWVGSPTTSATCPLGQYAAEYFANRTLAGQPTTTRCESPPIANDWGLGSPAGLPTTQFSARWSGSFELGAGNYTFTAVTDDGMRVWVDDKLALDEWGDQSATTYTFSLPLAAGVHRVTVEYYENSGLAVAKLSWAVVQPPPPQPSQPSAPSSNLGSKLPPRMPESSGTSLYVATNGNDAADCALARPCKSLPRVLALASSGTTIYMRGGRYDGFISLDDFRFSSSNPVTITNYAGEDVVLAGDGSGALPYYPALNLNNVVGIRVRGLEFSNANGGAVKVYDSSHVDLDRLYIHDNKYQGIFVGGGGVSRDPQSYSLDVQIWNSLFASNGQNNPSGPPHAIYYGGGPAPDGTRQGTLGGVIANNVLYDQIDGSLIQLYHEADGVIVTNNTLYHSYVVGSNKGQGMNIGNQNSDGWHTKNNVVVNNIITNNTAGIQSSCWASDKSTVVDYNLLFANPLGDLLDACQFTAGTHNITGRDPLYVNAPGHDFHLQPSSPARGKANPDYAPPLDADGNARPTAPALGAFG